MNNALLLVAITSVAIFAGIYISCWCLLLVAYDHENSNFEYEE